MHNQIVIDQYKIVEWDITASQACVFAHLFYKAQESNPKRHFVNAQGHQIGFLTCNQELMQEMPAFLKNDAHIKRYLALLQQKDLVQKTPAINKRGWFYLSLTEKAQTWGSLHGQEQEAILCETATAK